jgi:glyoxylate/hydroxypyruvate reductase A
MSHHLLIYHKDAKLYGEILSRSLPDLTIRSAFRTEDAIDFIENAEIILTWGMPDELLKKASHLKWFASLGAGNEHLIHHAMIPESVTFTKMTVYGEMVAEYVFAYLLYFCRDLQTYFEDRTKRVWNPRRPERLRGKVLGLLGLGSIGKEIAKRGKQFGMTVFGVKRNPESVENVDQVFSSEDLRKMIPEVDSLINTLPLTPATSRILGEKEFGLLKDGTIFFNIGRGKTIDQKALINHLKTGRIKAVLDVFEEEPLPGEHELWTLDNVILTPHISGINLPEEICEGFVRNYERWVRGEPLVGLVDREKGY